MRAGVSSRPSPGRALGGDAAWPRGLGAVAVQSAGSPRRWESPCRHPCHRAFRSDLSHHARCRSPQPHGRVRAPSVPLFLPFIRLPMQLTRPGLLRPAPKCAPNQARGGRFAGPGQSLSEFQSESRRQLSVLCSQLCYLVICTMRWIKQPTLFHCTVIVDDHIHSVLENASACRFVFLRMKLSEDVSPRILLTYNKDF